MKRKPTLTTAAALMAKAFPVSSVRAATDERPRGPQPEATDAQYRAIRRAGNMWDRVEVYGCIAALPPGVWFSDARVAARISCDWMTLIEVLEPAGNAVDRQRGWFRMVKGRQLIGRRRVVAEWGGP